MSETIHFIGVGKMGLPMATHLHAAGHTVTVSDPDAARLQLAAARGLKPASPDALASAGVVMSSLPHDGALRSVGAAVAATLPRGAVYVDTSTVSQAASAEVAQACEAAGVHYLRATVSGNNHMAEAAQLTVMASGPMAVHERLLPLLRCWGPNHFYLGSGEQARLMKLVVNLLIAQTSAMLAEGLTLGQKGGLAWEDMWAVLGASAVASPILKAKAVQLSKRDFSPTFTVTQMNKDLDLILGEAAACEAPVPQTAMTRQLMAAAQAQGDAGDDYAAIIKAVERSAGLVP
ncbi:MAG: NAD(P)-dependent oxidoreductase [Hydrogenophaga sp.]|uniref:NAD(P)-dependent oxidoreductase n=1 Tax=Hydrogenophaga sp. TaxID=1904254 RepID=UPI00260F0D22|nr:NAD(P)-dependent oxidoreductase [Hydrogenophaga sp.]MCV0438726.1 NAD(P)-dependent oxidoreductase [Hydrogenophaga sp.]